MDKYNKGDKKFWTVKELISYLEGSFNKEDKLFFDSFGRAQMVSASEETKGMVLSLKEILEY